MSIEYAACSKENVRNTRIKLQGYKYNSIEARKHATQYSARGITLPAHMSEKYNHKDCEALTNIGERRYLLPPKKFDFSTIKE